MKKIIAGFCTTAIGIAGVIGIACGARGKFVHGWTTSADLLLTSLKRAGLPFFFGLCACFLYLNVIAQFIDNALHKRCIH